MYNYENIIEINGRIKLILQVICIMFITQNQINEYNQSKWYVIQLVEPEQNH
jgi:hypothetical protein